MGTARIVAIRVAGSLVAVAASTASGLVVARKLGPEDYALYQLVSKRAYRVVIGVANAIGFWGYRSAARREPGSLGAILVLGLVSLVAGAALGLYSSITVSAPLGVGLLAGWALGLFSFYTVVAVAVNAARPARYSVLTMVQRTLYAVLVALLVYMAGMGVVGAFASLALASLVGSIAAFTWARKQLSTSMQRALSLLYEWARRAPVSGLSGIAQAVAALDVAVGYMFSSSLAVAAFFAASAAVTPAKEAVTTGLQYLHGRLVGGGESTGFSSAVRLLLVFTGFAAGYLALHSEHIVSLFNPRYGFAGLGLAVLGLEAHVSTYYTAAYFLALGSAKRVAGIARVNAVVLATSIAYVALVATTLYWLGNDPVMAVTGWALAGLARTVIATALLVFLLEKKVRIELARLAGPGLFYPLLALAASLVAPAPTPSREFWRQVAGITPSILVSLGIYTAVLLLVDKTFRQAVKKLPIIARRLVLPSSAAEGLVNGGGS